MVSCMNFIESIKERARSNRVRIILPEIDDDRVLEAASISLDEGIADIVLIGNSDEIVKARSKFKLDGALFINPSTFKLTNKLIDLFYDLRKSKGINYSEAKEIILNNYMYYACMLLKIGVADGIVSGASHSSADTLRPALQIIKSKASTSLVSAFFVMDVPNCSYGEDGLFIFADSGLNQYPNEEQLSDIAIDSAKSFKLLVNREPRVAMISHSTKGSANHENVLKMVNATRLVQQKAPSLKIDGELQVDAAIVPEIAELKSPNSDVAGKANILIFPDLDVGNTSYKLVERLANAKAYGPITQGIAMPVNDLSRGCSVDDIVGVIAITAVQAHNNVI